MPRVGAGLKKWHEEDKAKARHMLRRRSVDEVARYMGMPRALVERLDQQEKSASGTLFERTYLTHPVEPVESINRTDAWQHAAKKGSDALCAALAKTGARP